MANLYMVFPWMTHKHPYIRWYLNIVPWDLQGILWDKLIIPAMKKVTTPADELYIRFDCEDLIFKAQDKGQRQGEATYPLKLRQLTQFFNHVNEIVEYNCLWSTRRADNNPYSILAQIKEIPGGDLAKFGSAFYALEVKGCKGYMKEMVDNSPNTQAEGALKCALKNLWSYYSALDWEYMLDWKHGELFLGVTYCICPSTRFLWLDCGGWTAWRHHTVLVDICRVPCTLSTPWANMVAFRQRWQSNGWSTHIFPFDNHTTWHIKLYAATATHEICLLQRTFTVLIPVTFSTESRCSGSTKKRCQRKHVASVMSFMLVEQQLKILSEILTHT